MCKCFYRKVRLFRRTDTCLGVCACARPCACACRVRRQASILHNSWTTSRPPPQLASVPHLPHLMVRAAPQGQPSRENAWVRMLFNGSLIKKLMNRGCSMELMDVCCSCVHNVNFWSIVLSSSLIEPFFKCCLQFHNRESRIDSASCLQSRMMVLLKKYCKCSRQNNFGASNTYDKISK